MKKKPKTIPAGEFKAKCLKLMDDVAQNGETVVITKRGKPVAKLVPADEVEVPSLFGYMEGSVQFFDNSTEPIAVDWEANE